MRTLYKANDTERFGTVLATPDPDLTFPLLADSTYLIRGQLYFRGSTAGDLKHGFGVGGASVLRGMGCVWKWRYVRLDSVATYDENGGAWPAANFTSGQCHVISMSSGAYSMPVKFSIMLDIGNTGGDFSVIWAQNVADPIAPAVLLAGAIMTYEIMP